MVQDGARDHETSPPQDYHELRKKGKELRYLLELFGAQLFAPEVVDGLVRPLKALQDVLGRHQDREVQIAMLRSLADEVATLPRGPAGADGDGRAGRPAGRSDEAAARGDFAERFALLASSEQRRLVKERSEGMLCRWQPISEPRRMRPSAPRSGACCCSTAAAWTPA